MLYSTFCQNFCMQTCILKDKFRRDATSISTDLQKNSIALNSRFLSTCVYTMHLGLLWHRILLSKYTSICCVYQERKIISQWAYIDRVFRRYFDNFALSLDYNETEYKNILCLLNTHLQFTVEKLKPYKLHRNLFYSPNKSFNYSVTN